MLKHILLFLVFSSSFSQINYPSDFISPLNISLDLSGSFGELRSNHFHSGIDLKTYGKEGYEVFAVADGYVSRIKISTFGYGKAIYVTHPNGYTTVYGHLSKANGAIEDYIKKNHYKEQSYETEMYLKANQLPVKQGDVIAFTGNSGGSGAPHLHFEFRDSKTEKIINPLHFGFNKIISDKYEPFLQGIVAYPQDNTVVNGSQKPVSISFSKQADGSYLATKVKVNGALGFGINSYDYFTNPYNKNGLYKVSAYLNGVSYFQFDFETFAFDESRYINNFIDYERYSGMGQRIQKLFFKNPYNLSILKNSKNNGIINAQPDANYNYKIILEDFHGNKSEIIIPIVFEEQAVKIENKVKETSYFLKAKNEYNYTKENVSIYIPENTFYDNFYFDFDYENEILDIKNKNIPLHKYITIAFNDVTNLEPAILDKTFIASVSGHKLEYNKTYKKGNTLSTRVRELGSYKLAQDNDAPRIYNVNFVEGKSLNNQKTISVSISDALSGIDTYNGYINNQWILMEYDYKTKKLIYDMNDAKTITGRNDFKVIVTDEVGNTTTFESYFTIN